MKRKSASIKLSYKKELQKNKSRVKGYLEKARKATTKKEKKKWQDKARQYNNEAFRERKSKYGIYEKVNQIRTRTKGKENLSKQEWKTFKAFQTKIMNSYMRAVERFAKVDRKLDFDRISVLLVKGDSKYGEKMSLTQLLNALEYATPTDSREFKQYKQVMTEVLRRLRNVKANNKKDIYGNSNFHLGTINVSDLSFELSDEEAEEMNKQNWFDLTGGTKTISEDELNESMTEFDGDMDIDWGVKDEGIKLGPFKLNMNVSESTLIERIDLVGEPTDRDLKRLMHYVDKHHLSSRVDMIKFHQSVKRLLGKKRKKS